MKGWLRLTTSKNPMEILLRVDSVRYFTRSVQSEENSVCVFNSREAIGVEESLERIEIMLEETEEG